MGYFSSHCVIGKITIGRGDIENPVVQSHIIQVEVRPEDGFPLVCIQVVVHQYTIVLAVANDIVSIAVFQHDTGTVIA